jgi:hypothetical protein
MLLYPFSPKRCSKIWQPCWRLWLAQLKKYPSELLSYGQVKAVGVATVGCVGSK